MRDELEDAVELYEGMPSQGKKHWREKALPSIEFETEEEKSEFMAALDKIDESEED